MKYLNFRLRFLCNLFTH